MNTNPHDFKVLVTAIREGREPRDRTHYDLEGRLVRSLSRLGLTAMKGAPRGGSNGEGMYIPLVDGLLFEQRLMSDLRCVLYDVAALEATGLEMYSLPRTEWEDE